MDYEPYDSSGTDDDLPPSHQNRIPRGPHVAGNGRSSGIGSVPYAKMYSESDMEDQIHHLEQDAYIAVLRAFKAQADAITWEKESLITELRKELRLSNEEHRTLLRKVNEDDVIRRIRDWRKAGGIQPGMLGLGQAVHDPVPSPSGSASRKKQKINQLVPSQSFRGPSPPILPQAVTTSNQPSSSAPRRGGPITAPKGKKQKPGQILPQTSSMKMQHPSLGPGGRGQLGNRGSSGAHASEHAEAASLIGKKVKTRWPEDDTFYEAVITDYDPVKGKHALVYDIDTTNQTFEWIVLGEIAPGDIKWEGGDPGIFHRGGSGRGMNKSVGHEGIPDGAGRGRGLVKGPPRKDFPPAQNGAGKKVLGDIQLLHTDTLIKEVERIFAASNPDPVEIEKAKKVVMEHEQALADAIARLADFSDGESDEGGRFSHRQPMDRE